jgi:uncharacterized protein
MRCRFKKQFPINCHWSHRNWQNLPVRGRGGGKLHNPSINPEDTEPYTEEDTGFREFKLKLSKIRGRMLTAEGRRMARERHAFMEMFFERFLQEHEGHK